jgi:DNA mismatch repair protein MutS2
MKVDEDIEQLELSSLLKKLRDLIRTPYGQGQLENLTLLYDQQVIEDRLAEVSEMVALLEGGYGIPISELSDIRPLIDRLKPEEAFLEPLEINLVKSNLLLFEELSLFSKTHRDLCPRLADYFERIHPHRSIVREIERAIDSHDEIKEQASPELRRIRLEIHRLESEQKAVLLRVLKRYSEFSQDDIVTMRDGRIVLGIQQQYLSRINGIVHASSGTGATVFVEPMETLRISNQIQNLKMEERREIIRILKFLSGLVREVREDLYFSVENFGILDFIHAKALLARLLQASPVKISTTFCINLRDARHPLLILKMGYQNVISSSLSLGDQHTTLIITGPNAGGKTVALKMIGLLCLMIQLGLHIPAQPDSMIPIFDKVLVDIGDRQNLEQDLSTFSAHIIRLQDILQQATARSLILIDEIGTGTDPREGSSLAIAFLSELNRRRILTIATTHHGELKAFAFNTPGVENASMEFDLGTLLPTYRLQIGIPGSSYAFEIARRYGLSETVLKEAVHILGAEKNQLENLIINLNQRLQQTEKERREVNIKLSQSDGLKNLYQAELEKLRREKSDLRRQAAEEAQKIVEEANSAIERLIADIRRTQAQKEKIKEAHQKIAELRQVAENVLKETEPSAQTLDDLHEGDVVWIESLRVEGELVAEPDKQQKAWVLVNDLRMNLPLQGIKKIAKPQADSRRILTRQDSRSEKLEEGILPELDLRGMDSYQAIEETNSYLDQALQQGWEEIRIIHGKGTGVLRKQINAFLAKDSRVEHKRLGKWGEGDTGVTIVRLKK